MPIPSQDPKKAFAEIAARREAELQAQKDLQERAMELEKERNTAEELAYIAEQSAAKERSEEREQWRQDRHAESREMQEKRRLAEIARVAEEERKEKLKKEQQLKDERMAELHRKAVEKRVAEKIEGAKVEEERRKKDATYYEERSLSTLDAEVKKNVEHVLRESAQRKHALQVAADRTRLEADEAYALAKRTAETQASSLLRSAKTEQEKRDIRMGESHMLSTANAERRRALFALDETLAQKLFDIDTQTKRLIDEIKRDADAKKRLATRDADRKRMDAEAQREGVEKWFGRNEKKRDSKDPLG